MDPRRLTRFLDQEYLRPSEDPFNRSSFSAPPAEYLRSLTQIAVKFAAVKGEPFERLKPGSAAFKPEPMPAGGIFGSPARQSKPPPGPQDEVLLDRGLLSGTARLPSEQFVLGHAVQPGPVVDPPPPEVAPPPKATMHEPTEGLTLPSVRRQRNQLQAERLRAEKVKRTVAAQKQRTLELMKKRHPSGVLGVDSPAVTEAVRTMEHTRLAARRAAERRQAILERTSGAAMRGYNPLVPDADPTTFVPSAAGQVRPRPDATASGTKLMQSKARAGPAEDTHSRIFQAPTLREQHPVRLEYIRNNSTRGKAYNPVTGAVYKHHKPTVPEAKDVRRGHPSITAVEATLPR